MPETPGKIELIGTNGADTITGSSSDNEITGVGGADTLNGGNDTDVFRYLGSGDAVTGEVVNGNGGADFLQVGDFSLNPPLILDFTQVTLNSVEHMRFLRGATTTFTPAQIASFTSIEGSFGSNQIFVSGSVVDLSAIDFINWGPVFIEFPPSQDIIQITGTAGADQLTGSEEEDLFMPGGGADTVSGGAKLDSIGISAPGDLVAGESLSGGAGSDLLFSLGIGNFDFSVVTLDSIEILAFNASGQTATFSGTQIGVGGSISTVIGGGGGHAIVVNGAAVDLSNLSFTTWSFGSSSPNTITINGTAGADTLTGSHERDWIIGGAGADFLTGGGGDDRYVYAPGDGADTVAGFLAGFSDDRIDLTAFDNLGTFTNLLERITQNGAHAVIDFGGGDTITLQNVQKANLTRDDFIGLRAVRQDLDGQGTSDILWRHDSGGLLIWELNDSQIENAHELGGRGLDWHFAGDGDFNGDTTADLLWRNDNGAVEISEMGGGQIVATRSLGVVTNDWHIADTAYFNNDETSDILWRHDSGQLAIWDMSGGAQSGYHFLGFVDSDWVLTDTGDFNGDGQTDILWRHTTGAAAAWDIHNGAQVGYHFLGPVGNDWHVADTGDFNGDRTADILWQHDFGPARDLGHERRSAVRLPLPRLRRQRLGVGRHRRLQRRRPRRHRVAPRHRRDCALDHQRQPAGRLPLPRPGRERVARAVGRARAPRSGACAHSTARYITCARRVPHAFAHYGEFWPHFNWFLQMVFRTR